MDYVYKSWTVIHNYYFSKSKFAYMVYIFPDSVESSVNRDLCFRSVFWKPLLSFIGTSTKTAQKYSFCEFQTESC